MDNKNEQVLLQEESRQEECEVAGENMTDGAQEVEVLKSDQAKKVWENIKPLVAKTARIVRAFVIKTGREGKRLIERLGIKKTALLCVGVICIFIAAAVGLSVANNHYTTPIRLYEKYNNKETVDYERQFLDYSRHLAGRELEDVYKVIHNSNDYMDARDMALETMIAYKDDFYAEYGDNAHITYKVIDKVELTKAELRELRETLQENCVEEYREEVDSLEDLSSSEWSEAADELDLTKADAKELIMCLEQYCDALGRLRVTEGYELTVERTITGSELDEPFVTHSTETVVKVNGKWLSADWFMYSDIFAYFDYAY